MTRGRSGAWVAGNLTWSRLDYLLLRDEYPVAHVRLLHELYALYRASATARSSYYGYGYAYGGDQRYLELSGCESRQLWPVLEQAHAAGLPLVYPRRQGLVPPPGTAELRLDVTSEVTDEGTALLIAPVIKTPDGDDAVPLSFIGTEGHGVVLADRAQARQSRQPEHARFRLARLAAPVPRQLQQLALADERLVVPPAGQAAFLSRYYPRLRRMAPVISSDGSFTPPRISEPRLVLSVRYFGAHDVDLRWEWAYQVGDAELRAAVGSRPAEFRDPAAEARVLAGVDLDLPERARFSAATLHGLDTMVFSTEVLPLLSGRDDVRVEVSGRVPDYREAGDSLRIGVSAAELDGEQDWFDLGITVTVEGREVPFAELFVALASGQSHLLLPDGAYFSLDKPELMALARLIEEARALTDQPAALDGPLRISRFQAGLWDELAGLGVVRHQAAAWQRQVQGCCSRCPPSSTRRRLRRLTRCCARISAPGSSGSRSCGSTGSAASSPTTWGWARRCRRWRCSPRTPGPRVSDAKSLPHRRADERAGELGGGGAQVHPGPEGGDDRGHAGPARRGARVGDRGGGRGGDVVHPAAAGLRVVRGAPLGGAGARRGAVREEPPAPRRTRARGRSPHRSRWRSPARRWRTT